MNCYYCGKPVSGPWEYQRDHFPKPRSIGGRETVIACNRCHHIKDRYSNRQWDDLLGGKLMANVPDQALFLHVVFLDAVEDADAEMALRVWHSHRNADDCCRDLLLVQARIVSNVFRYQNASERGGRR